MFEIYHTAYNIADELLTVGHMYFPRIVQKFCKTSHAPYGEENAIWGMGLE